jgi:hypothetical protein
MTQLTPHPYDIATISQVRASRQFRVTVDTNHYSVPAEYAGARLTLKTYPDRLCIYHQDKRDQKIFIRFLSLSDKADV